MPQQPGRTLRLHPDQPRGAHTRHFSSAVVLGVVVEDLHHLVLLETADRKGCLRWGGRSGGTDHEGMVQQLGGCGPEADKEGERPHGRTEEVSAVTVGREEARHELFVRCLGAIEHSPRRHVLHVDSGRFLSVFVQSRVRQVLADPSTRQAVEPAAGDKFQQDGARRKHVKSSATFAATKPVPLEVLAGAFLRFELAVLFGCIDWSARRQLAHEGFSGPDTGTKVDEMD
mmetsp:Transcript_20323/g.47540  ORF Transcript_20323/g.47540 Transcript_20323/m.47540 type:complete len:229 (-) Transcript_20323:212-898(-)